MPGMPSLVMMVGLPRSGKTTEALRLNRGNGWPIVCPDTIRLALHGQRYQHLAEPFVWAIAKVMVRALFLAGHGVVILDACNGTRARRKDWHSEEWRTVHLTVGTTKEECVRRAEAEGDSEIVPVIERMSASWEPVGPDEVT